MGEKLQENGQAGVLITPEMVAAGAEVICDYFGEVTTYQPWLGPDVAEKVYLAMLLHPTRQT